jgi:Mn2+/Fe2+ NRAMP family transporter
MVLATDTTEYVGLIIAVHLLTEVPLDVAAVFALVDVVLLASLSDRRALFARVIGGSWPWWRLASWSSCGL